MLDDKTPSASSTPARTPRQFNVMESSLYFVCDTRQENEIAHCNDRGIGRCSLDSSKRRLTEPQKIHILNKSSHFCPAAHRLKMATGCSTYDIFAADVLYQKLFYESLYIFYCSRSIKDNNNNKKKDNKNKKEEVIRRFCRFMEQRVLNNKNYFFLKIYLVVYQI